MKKELKRYGIESADSIYPPDQIAPKLKSAMAVRGVQFARREFKEKSFTFNLKKYDTVFSIADPIEEVKSSNKTQKTPVKKTFIGFYKRILEKQSSSWSKTRKIAFLLVDSPLKRVIDAILILIFLILSPMIDFDKLESRNTAPFFISRNFFFTFLLLHNIWFTLIFLMGLISKSYEGMEETRYLNSFLNLLDFSLAVAVYASPSRVGFLCVLRVLRLVSYLKAIDHFEYLREVSHLLNSSLLPTMSIIGVLVVCVLFLSMLLNTLVVGLSELRAKNSEVNLARCRFLDSDGLYKIDNNQVFICSIRDPALACLGGTVCMDRKGNYLNQNFRKNHFIQL